MCSGCMVSQINTPRHLSADLYLHEVLLTRGQRALQDADWAGEMLIQISGLSCDQTKYGTLEVPFDSLRS